MMALADWKPTKLDELGFVGRGKSRHRPRNAPSLYGGRHPFFQTGDVKAANFYLTEYSQTYSEEGLAQSKLWKPGTLCITIAANIAESAILGVEGCFPDSVIGFVANPEKADVRFIKYYMEILKLQMQSVSRGTTQDNLSMEKLLTFDFRVPPLPVQQRIADILSAYDELIENSQRRIKILESMASALYCEWFVHFRFPGSENHPRVASPLGEIPQGWEVKKLKDVCRLTMGQSPKSEFYNEVGDGMPVHQGVTDFGDRFPTDRLFCTAEGRIGQAGDILFSVRAPVGRMNIANKKIILGRGLSAIRHNDDSQAFLWEQLRNRFIKEDMMGNGAIFASVTKDDMQGIELVCPPSSVVDAATKHFEPLHSEIAILSQQVQNLCRTRDLLLPRLLSGQIDLGGDEGDGLAHGVASPAPVNVPLHSNASIKAEVVTRKTAIEPADASRPIGTVERDEVLCAIRKVFGDGVERSRDMALRDIAYALRYQRLGPRIREALSADFMAALRRGIVVNAGGKYRLGFRSFADCPRDVLKDAFESAIGRAWIVREDAIRAFARWAGFGRVGDVIDQTARSLINGLIREGRVETDGPELIRRT